MAGQVFPSDGPRPTGSHAEKKLWAAMVRYLPNGWRAWHSLRVRVAQDWEGEGDFVIADPQRGILILEVKGGNIELQGGRWLQNGKPLAKAPRDQGQRFARILAQELENRGAEVPPWGVACAFPDVAFSDAPTGDGLKGAVIGERELAWLGESLQSVFENVVPHRTLPRSPRWITVLQDMWGHTWVPKVDLTDRIEGNETRLLALEREQMQILDFAQDNKMALVEGGAGSGKTIVARELCVRTARAGELALYLCFTVALARAVDRSFAPLRAQGHRIYAMTVRGLAGRVLSTDKQGAAPSNEDSWRQALMRAGDMLFQQMTPAPELVAAATHNVLPADDLELSSLPPDLVVVDEAQDLTEEDWLFVQTLADSKKLWAFRDPAQKFWSNRGVPEGLFERAAHLRLIQQHRNPTTVHQFSALYREPDPGAEAGGTMEQRLKHVPRNDNELRLSLAKSDTPESLHERLRHEVDQLRAQGVAVNDIAVISLMGLEKSALCKLNTIGSHIVRKADADDAHAHIILDTFLRFKGLERPVVIVVELPHDSSRYDLRMHVGITRATTLGIVVCGPASLAADVRLSWLAGPSRSGPDA